MDKGADRLADLELLKLHMRYGVLADEDFEGLLEKIYLSAFPPIGGAEDGEEIFMKSVMDVLGAEA